MNRIRTALLAGGLVAALVPAISQAQVFTPSYLSPTASSDAGIFFSDGPGDFSFEGILRGRFMNSDIGLRAGLANAGGNGSVGIMLGGDYRHPVTFGGPVDMAITGAIQTLTVTKGGDTGIGFSAGVTAGRSFLGNNAGFTPYIHPRLGVVTGYGATDFDLLLDAGLDVRLNSSLVARLGVALEGYGGADWGLGISWR
ncbi:MAG: hypothetical protein LBG44_06370 [Gemmatimonadota bacterium]|jgi:hypothetical protein|nr:hypothetical protein [Gemmatimonadota bacterium]